MKIFCSFESRIGLHSLLLCFVSFRFRRSLTYIPGGTENKYYVHFTPGLRVIPLFSLTLLFRSINTLSITHSGRIWLGALKEDSWKGSFHYVNCLSFSDKPKNFVLFSVCSLRQKDVRDRFSILKPSCWWT